MPAGKSSFLDKVLGRLDRLDAEGLQAVVRRLAEERALLDTLFNTIEDGVMVLTSAGDIDYANAAATRLLGRPAEGAEGDAIRRFLPELDWDRVLSPSQEGVVRHEVEISYPRPRFLSVFAAPLNAQTDGSRGTALVLHDATETRQKTFEAIESERAEALKLLASSGAHAIGQPPPARPIHLQLIEREVRTPGRLAEGLTTPAPPPSPRLAASARLRKTKFSGWIAIFVQ